MRIRHEHVIMGFSSDEGERNAMDIKAEALKKHYEWAGKLEVTPRAKVQDRQSLSLAYTPGVA